MWHLQASELSGEGGIKAHTQTLGSWGEGRWGKGGQSACLFCSQSSALPMGYLQRLGSLGHLVGM